MGPFIHVALLLKIPPHQMFVPLGSVSLLLDTRHKQGDKKKICFVLFFYVIIFCQNIKLLSLASTEPLTCSLQGWGWGGVQPVLSTSCALRSPTRMWNTWLRLFFSHGLSSSGRGITLTLWNIYWSRRVFVDVGVVLQQEKGKGEKKSWYYLVLFFHHVGKSCCCCVFSCGFTRLSPQSLLSVQPRA